ncbi:MAG: hypothetical protein ACJA1R_001182, partial [Flavobacteriales bacterium]
ATSGRFSTTLSVVKTLPFEATLGPPEERVVLDLINFCIEAQYRVPQTHSEPKGKSQKDVTVFIRTARARPRPTSAETN